MLSCFQACPVVVCLDMRFITFIRSFCYILYVWCSRHNATSSSLEYNGSLHSVLNMGNEADIASFCRLTALTQPACFTHTLLLCCSQTESLLPSPACQCKTQSHSEVAGHHFANLAAMLRAPRVRLLVEWQTALRCCR